MHDTTHVEIRRLRDDDVEAVVRLWRRAREDAQPWLEARMGHTPEDDLGFFRGTLMQENDVWVALDAVTPVAFFALAGTQLNYLYVDPPHQNRGLGTLLLDKVKTISPAGFTLFTHQRNEKARAFYERREFRAIAFGVSPPPENEPDVKYEWVPA